MFWLPMILGCMPPLQVTLDDSGADLGDRDGDGVPHHLDCDDQDAQRFPGNAELCDQIDNDCDELVDEGALNTGWLDEDGDGFGAGDKLETCAELTLVDQSGDCDDDDGSVHPGVIDDCDERDNDCDDSVDEDADQVDWYPDIDQDGFGDESAGESRCDGGSPGWVKEGGDCDDTDADTYPGAQDFCDGVDQDCDGFEETLGTCCAYVTGTVDGASYDAYLCSDELSWFKARERCQALGTDLESIHSNGENRFLKDNASSRRFWIGMSDYANEGTWEWSDATGVDFTFWNTGEPNNWNDNEHCAEAGYYSSGKWNDTQCSESKPFYCAAE